MKIFFITSKLNFLTAGGSVEEFDLMIKDLIELGNDVTVVTAFSYANKIPAPLSYKLIEENIADRGLLGIQRGIFKILWKYSDKADFFHIDGHNFLYGAGLYRRLGGKVPVSAFFNRELSGWPENTSNLLNVPQNSILKRLKKIFRWHIEKYFGMPLANGIDLFSFTNPVLRGQYEKFGLRKNSNMLIIGDPLDFPKIFKKNNISPDMYLKRNKRNGKIILFYSSRMAPGKGFDLLLTAFSKLKDKDNFHLILGGTGPEEELIKKMVRDLGLDPYVEMPGWVAREKLFQYYREADIFIQARWRNDLTSISLLYAMAFGLPCIIPGGGGLEWDAGEAALCFRDEDYNDLADKIEKLGKDHELRNTLSRNCYVRLGDDDMNHKKQVLRLYESMEKINKKFMENTGRYKRSMADRLISAGNAIYYILTEPVKLWIARIKFKNLYKNDANPLVSIVMPTFKREQLLKDRTLPAIFAQTYQNFEVIIVGDNRLDDTEEMIKKLNDSRIKFYHLPEYDGYPANPKLRWFVGGTPPRNRGLELARGKWIAELDDDEILLPDFIESLLAFAQKNKYEFVSAAYEEEKRGKKYVVDAKDLHPRIGGIGTWLYRSYLRLFRYNINCWRKHYNCPQEIDRALRMHNAGVRIGFLEKTVMLNLPLPGMDTTGLDALELRSGQKLR